MSINIKEIKNPKFLKNLKNKELISLSKEIREEIIKSVSINGGHLSSNLGSVESIIALHKFFDFSKDKILFDVGHQCYTHKILTGRSLDNLRKKNGISGFPKISESDYDHFESGHSSNSLSAAIGFAIKRDENKENYEIIDYIGDSSFSNGLIFEALNDEQIKKHKIIIILNDNDMSISKTVGNVSKLLQKISTSLLYNRLKTSYKKSTTKNKFGKWLYRVSYKFKNFIKNLFFSKNIFTILDLNYIGIIDGHNFKELQKAFKKAKNSNKTVVIHIKTIKGLGYKKAENDTNGIYHGVKPFKINDDDFIKDKNSFSFLYSSYIQKYLCIDKKVKIISPATMVGSDLIELKEKYPQQVFDVGIAEEHSLALAAGMALSGLKPYIFIYSTFLQRAFDQVINDIARLNLNVKLLIDRCGFIGEDGNTHLGIFDESFLLSIPNTLVCFASNEFLAKKLIDISYNYNGFMCIRYPKTTFITNNSFISKYKNINIGDWIYLLNNNNNNNVLISFGPLIYKINDLIKTKSLNINIIEAIFQTNYLNNKIFPTLLKYKNIFIYNPYGLENGFSNCLLKELILKGFKNNIYDFSIKKQFINQMTINESLKEEELLPTQIISKIENILKNENI